ncbi:gsl1983 [Gloeobacter violaceus PCC 7421]|uniref:Gsl1983 protein n=1 Tax=Gloeobacter violaceus (strain ATCC 29082 / PCC 7421) TaxID=251221 RepID=Q7NJ49_GLOVI|nr:gsl1983 [Gloeobacter violaceus PCC 7421]
MAMPSSRSRRQGPGPGGGAFFDLDNPLHLVKVQTLCPRCGQTCTWYRLGDRLWELCPGHGSARSLRGA